jgi:hypothetical protein
MVSLDARNQFIADLRATSSSGFVLALILGEDCPDSTPTTVSDRGAQAIVTDDKSAFESAVEELESRKVRTDSDWVLDDFLLFVLLVGAKKFNVGDELCKSMLSPRRPTNELDTKFNNVMRSLSQDALAIEGAFSFAKLVFADLTGQATIDNSVARTVYGELTATNLEDLATLPRLLAYRAFDILLSNRVEDELNTVDAIASAIQSRSENMSIGDWLKIGLAMRPGVLMWICGLLIAACTASFSAGKFLANSPELEGPAQETARKAILAPPKDNADEETADESAE